MTVSPATAEADIAPTAANTAPTAATTMFTDTAAVVSTAPITTVSNSAATSAVPCNTFAQLMLVSD